MTDIKIPLHPEFGLNATISQCFWCKKAKGGIAPLGSRIDGKAEPLSVLDYGPCEACKAKMIQGITVIEMASAKELNQPELLPGTAPTGRWFVLTEERFRNLAKFLQLSDSHIIPILANRRMFTERDIYNRVAPTEALIDKKPARKRRPKTKKIARSRK
jgi:hypothetical protein